MTPRAGSPRVWLEGVGKRRVWEISGGQRQRVPIARALAAENPLLLPDEPFAAPDALTREGLQEDVRRVTAQTGRTAVFVTHAADEVVFLGSRVVVLSKRPGRVVLDPLIPLPRTGTDPEERRAWAEFAALLAQAVREVKATAA